jgi:D-psicose/D-tagatose/L-ribulose 3-epimerase
MISCVSNLAWSISEEKKALKLLKKYKIKKLEFSPNLLLDNNFTKQQIQKVKKKWKSNGIALYSMQSILYKIENAFIFGTKYQNLIFFKEVKKKIELASILGVKVIVFGSPINRRTFSKKKKILNKIFINTFKKLSVICKKNRVKLCIEANPKIYKSEFLLNTDEVCEIVRKINRTFVLVNLDLGAMIYNRENIKKIVKKNINLIGHVQISAPGLKNVSKHKKTISLLLNTLQKYDFSKTVSLELLMKNKNNLNNLNKNLRIIEECTPL